MLSPAGRPQLGSIMPASLHHTCDFVILIMMVIYYEPWLVNLGKTKRMEGKDY